MNHENLFTIPGSADKLVGFLILLIPAWMIFQIVTGVRTFADITKLFN